MNGNARGLRLGVLCIGLLCIQWPAPVQAAPRRRLFEPTDLELQDPGVAEFDMQYGLVRSDAYRLSCPDFEFNLGLTRTLELDIDGEMAVGGPDNGDLILDHSAPDNLWIGPKVGLLTFEDKTADLAWALGIQLGPKVPVAHGAHGVGFEGLTLLSFRIHRTYLVLNLGGLVDPAADASSPRPSGFEMGLDLNYPLNTAETWALTGEIGAVTYLSSDPNQLTTSLGITWSPFDYLDLSVVGVYGWLRGGDQYGVLLGITPRVHLW